MKTSRFSEKSQDNDFQYVFVSKSQDYARVSKAGAKMSRILKKTSNNDLQYLFVDKCQDYERILSA